MLFGEFFVWWYTRGWYQVVLDLRRRVRSTLNMFSAPILLRTLFAPWRRIVSDPGDDVAAKFKAMGDNLVSRFVGFVVRLFTLLIVFLMLVAVAVFNLILIFLWPLLPLALVVAIIKGIIG